MTEDQHSSQQPRNENSVGFFQLSARALDELRMNLGFFTRLPTFAGGMLSAQGRDPNPDVQRHLFACSFWATPISALIIGGIMAALWWLVMTIWHNPLLAAGLALAAHALLTGALHDDGLADLADAMGGADPQRRLEIMSDSRIGSYGVVALVLWYAIAIAGISSLLVGVGATALMASAILSRCFIPMGLHLLPSAKQTGLGQSASGSASPWPALIAVGVGNVLALVILGVPAILILVAVLAAQGAVVALAWRLVGGMSGDVYGAGQRLGELAGLLTAAAIWTA